MVKQSIQIFARIKPTKAKIGLYDINSEAEDGPVLSFNVPREQSGGYINNKKEDYKFKFQNVFDKNAKQDEIFDDVARPVIDNVLEGYNGTIFAYGQTGSGKTFTITGGAERYVDRGIIPRSLSYVFEHCKNNPEVLFKVEVSYLEIYNESGYDLLNPKHEAAKLEDLPKVMLREVGDNIHLTNMSMHEAHSEEEALNLLFMGDTNRMIAETPMNQASTRSHCIFTIHVESREAGSAVARRSKLHLVDLAGSERVSKTGVDGVLLKEAKYINLSLHYLEQVIISLSEKNRSHIPYRNSMMTSVLRDSLGGNSLTTMIATCSVEKKNMGETIATCNFAQRVAMIKNDAILNEELDPKLLIARLKREVAQLKDELSMSTGEQRTDALTDEDLERCKEAVQQYLEDNDPEAVINIGVDMRKLNECFRLMKLAVSGKGGGTSNPSSQSPQRTSVADQEPENYLQSQENKKLQELVLQRDNEINILVKMLKQERKVAHEATHKLESMGHKVTARSTTSANDPRVFKEQNGSSKFSAPRSHSVGNDLSLGDKQEWSSPEDRPRTRDEVEENAKRKILGDMSIGRQEAFEIFRRDYVHSPAIDENKQILRTRFAEAKQLGEKINLSRTAINKAKSAIQHHRMSRAMEGQVDPDDPDQDMREMELRSHMEREKGFYKQFFERLKAVKTETEHLQHLLEKSKLQLMKDFELWWTEQASQVQRQTPRSHKRPPTSGTRVVNAWKTPPVTPAIQPLQPSSDETLSCASSLTSLASERSIDSVKRSTGRRIDYVGTSSSNSSVVSSASRRRQQQYGEVGGLQLTGDEEVDADIRAFVKARENVVKNSQPQAR